MMRNVPTYLFTKCILTQVILVKHSSFYIIRILKFDYAFYFLKLALNNIPSGSGFSSKKSAKDLSSDLHKICKPQKLQRK